MAPRNNSENETADVPMEWLVGTCPRLYQGLGQMGSCSGPMNANIFDNYCCTGHCPNNHLMTKYRGEKR